MPDCSLTAYTPAHWPDVQRIYAQGIATRQATFETRVPSESDWSGKFIDGLCRVAETDDGQIAGWAGAVASSDRCVYAGVAEVSVYVGQAWQGQGVGRHLLEDLIGLAESAGIWTLQAGIFPENAGSIALHLACGFRLVGYREALGRLDGHWRDVNQYERRSRSVGI